jgi:hypothetical protein
MSKKNNKKSKKNNKKTRFEPVINAAMNYAPGNTYAEIRKNETIGIIDNESREWVVQKLINELKCANLELGQARTNLIKLIDYATKTGWVNNAGENLVCGSGIEAARANKTADQEAWIALYDGVIVRVDGEPGFMVVNNDTLEPWSAEQITVLCIVRAPVEKAWEIILSLAVYTFFQKQWCEENKQAA